MKDFRIEFPQRSSREGEKFLQIFCFKSQAKPVAFGQRENGSDKVRHTDGLLPVKRQLWAIHEEQRHDDDDRETRRN